VSYRSKYRKQCKDRGPSVLRTIQVQKSGPSVIKQIPSFMVLNARSLAKPDACAALYMDLKSKNIDVCCISKTWQKKTHMDHVICPQGFTIVKTE
jgi:hypothetical protein